MEQAADQAIFGQRIEKTSCHCADSEERSAPIYL